VAEPELVRDVSWELQFNRTIRERTNLRQGPLHAQAQLRRQLQRRAAHFRLQQHKYAKEHTADALRRSISFALRAELSHALSAASNEMLPLKPKHFPPGLFTNI
jgi:hypothetical protein